MIMMIIMNKSFRLGHYNFDLYTYYILNVNQVLFLESDLLPLYNQKLNRIWFGREKRQKNNTNYKCKITVYIRLLHEISYVTVQMCMYVREKYQNSQQIGSNANTWC